LAEFARVIKDPKDNPLKVYTFIWYLRALNHAGRPVPQNLKDIAVKAEGTWPRQAFGLFTGTGTPEKTLEVVNKLQGDNHDIALCEAYFYIGDYYLLQQDKDKAAEYFKKSRATGVSYLEEYVAAERELARMDRQ
jgi:lipoprotein NlpI